MMTIATGHETPLISTTVQASEAPPARRASQSLPSAAASVTTGEAPGVPAMTRQAPIARSIARTTAGGSPRTSRSRVSTPARNGPGSGSPAAPGTAASQPQATDSDARTPRTNPSR